MKQVFTPTMRLVLFQMAHGKSWDFGVGRMGGSRHRMMHRLFKAGCVTERPWRLTPKGRGIGTGSTKP